MKKLQVIKVENDIVQKTELQTGCNSISRTIAPGCDNEQVIKHALTINLLPDGEMTITPYQVSACYIKSHGACKWQLVELGTSVPIEPGDICSLLHDRCWLKIIDAAVMEESNNTLKRKVEEDTDEKTLIKRICPESNVDIVSSNNDFRDAPDRDNAEGSTSSQVSLSKDNEHSMAEEGCGSEIESQPSITGQEPVDINEHTGEQNEETLLIKQESSSAPNEVASNGNVESDVTSDANDLTVGNPSQLLSTEANRASPSVADDTQVVRRNKCAYGDNCYRKNQFHKTKFSHPGDADYDIPDDRPECSYGVQCYRTNPEHKSTYKHTSLHSLRRNTAGVQRTLDDSPFDDYESPAEESVDESDYEPSDFSFSSHSDTDDDDIVYVDTYDDDDDADYAFDFDETD